jgi:hypothetical protein
MKVKTKTAFGLIEVMLALLVAAMIITPLSRLVLSVIENVSRSDEILVDQIQLKRFLYESRFFAGTNETFLKEAVIDNRKTMVFTRTPIAEKSVFFRPFLSKEEVVMKDKTAPKEITTLLVTFYAVIPEQKKKEAEKQKKGDQAEKRGAV